MSNPNSRVVFHDRFDGKGFVNANSLAAAQLTKPDKITPVITHLFGRDEKKFPLTFLTEGQKGGRRPVELNDIQYEWDIFRKLRKSDAILTSTYVSTDKPGLNSTTFQAVFETDWIQMYHTIVAPDGTQARVMTKPVRQGSNYLYVLQLVDPAAATFCDPALLQAGTRWSMEGGAAVSASESFGNTSNRVFPGKMKNQISILRKSMRWGGNVANKAVEVQFNLDGKNTNLWMAFEEYKYRMDWMQEVEEHLWWSTYNRREDGSIPLKDENSGLDIPMGAGMVDQIPNNDTYAFLTSSKLKSTVWDVMYGATDTKQMVVALFTGEGGADEFHNAIMETASGVQVWSGPVGEKLVKGEGFDLKFGAYFNTYITAQGHMIIVKLLNILDHGARAENSAKHPVSGKPMSSYEMFFTDMSSYDGEPNVKMVTEKGRSMVRGIVRGMANVMPDMDFGGNSESLATEQDIASIHFLSAKGVCIRRNTHCFRLSCDLS